MLRTAIVGASGYTGGELARLLCNHPAATLTVATSRQYDGQLLSKVYPHLRDRVDIICRNLGSAEIIDQADLIFCAVPHKTAMNVVPAFLDAGKKVVDLSADFRLKDVAVYEQWYQPHSAANLIADAVYGLPEIYREEIRSARLVANPGCYPTSITLGLAPLMKADIVDPDTIIIDSKSGTSGAGRAAQVGTLFCEVTDGFRPYKVGGVHRHIPEIEQNLSALAGSPVKVSFTPHLLPVSRGILSTIYVNLCREATLNEISGLYQKMYGKEPFVRLLDSGSLPATQQVRGSNYCDISLNLDERTGRLIIVSAIDNIVKGASGQAVQNMNLMCGFDEDAGLQQAPLFP
ncbi:MAG: N-acetyl-gamma-glutamyl-phosphate reductase [Desulfofustis sp.]|nr:N-acetyl-gamma-glutamyl-phosphate reductase [Desulfofustis sp.]MBT8353749.1 N-acetyl-gamma-glutamyl-phosphate reductase [Desulfofustis sp.]